MQSAWNDANFRNIIMREPISGVVCEPQYNITLSGVLKGSPVSIDTSELKSATLSNRAFASSNLSVGDFCGRRFETSLFNFEGTYDDAVWESNVFELTYSVKKYDNSWVDISYGDFIVTEYSEIDGVIRLVLEDNRALFDVVFDTGFTVGETMFSALGKICAKAGVTLGSTSGSFPNSSVVITNTAELVDMTCAQLVSFIAQACGRVAYIGKDNKLYLGWFSIPANAPKCESRAIGMGQTVALGSVSVTGMKWIKSDGTEIIAGTNDYVITVSNNPILVSNFSALLTNASANLVGFEYTPTENKLLYFNPAMDILDVITVENRNGVEIELPIMDININGFGGMQANSYGEGEKAKAKNFKSVSSVIETVSRGVVEAKRQASSAMLSADGKNAIYRQETEPTGGIYKEGDIWFDTDNSNKMHEWNGSEWIGFQLGEDAIANLSITNAKIANGTIESAKIANLDAGKINTGDLTVGGAGGNVGSIVVLDGAGNPITTIDKNGVAVEGLVNASGFKVNAGLRPTIYTDMGDIGCNFIGEFTLNGTNYELFNFQRIIGVSKLNFNSVSDSHIADIICKQDVRIRLQSIAGTRRVEINAPLEVTGTVSGFTPTAAEHLTTKAYVDEKTDALDFAGLDLLTSAYDSVGTGQIRWFRTSPNTTSLPANITTWQYAMGYIYKSTTVRTKIILFGSITNDVAYNTYNGSVWVGWTIK